MPGQVLAGYRAVHGAHRAGEKAKAINNCRHFVLEHPQARLAAVQRFERRKRFAVPLDRIRELEQQGRPFRGRRGRPRLERLLRRGHSLIHLLQRSFGQVD